MIHFFSVSWHPATATIRRTLADQRMSAKMCRMARTADEEKIIQTFLEPHFGIDFKPVAVGKAEQSTTKGVLTYIEEKFAGMRYVLGLALDFTLLAQQISNHDPDAKKSRPNLTKEELFNRYEFVTSRDGRTANTLSLKYQSQTIGIRKIEESVVDLFGELSRPGYPSAYVYNTGQWHKYQDTLLIPCFQLSESSRYHLANALIDYALEHLTASRFYGREIARVRLFEEILSHYSRTQAGENSGAVFQGLAYGFIKADRPHLSLIVDKVRTGSARQHRIGDIDGYFGLDLELSVEVKDHPLTKDNVAKELGEFLGKVTGDKVMGLAFVLEADDKAKSEMQSHGVDCLTLGNVLWIAGQWDWRKQDAAVHGLLHYLAHVEQNPDAVERLLEFIKQKDSSHDSLAYYRPPQRE